MANFFIWILSALAIAGIIFRPFKLPEMLWAGAAAVLLVASRCISTADAWSGVQKGIDVYLFLTGMMLLAECAREARLFDWLASLAARRSGGDAKKLFLLIYLVGTPVTVLLSNDATAVVLTPAVAAVVRTARVSKPLPYLFICAFIANAASFVLPISNPANLVIYGKLLPPLLEWLPLYFIPSLVSIVVTFFVLRFTQRKHLPERTEAPQAVPVLSTAGKLALWGIITTTVLLLISSGLGYQLGLPTAITGVSITLLITVSSGKNPFTILKGVSWPVLPLVAGLFVIVEALNKTGVSTSISEWLNGPGLSEESLMWLTGIATALTSNVMNNLPVGLLAGDVIGHTHLSGIVRSAVLIGIDLGPNLSITGSLATMLWLNALKREGIAVSGWEFLKVGFLVMTSALFCTLASVWLISVI